MAIDHPVAVTAANHRLLPFIALIAGAIAMGISPIFVRLADVGPFASAFWRVSLALPLLWTWMRWDTGLTSGLPASARNGRTGGLIILAGLLFSGDLFFWHLAITKTTVANATFFATMAPLVTIAIATALLKERMTGALLGGLALCITGASLILGSSVRLDPERLAGDGYGIVTALFFGLYMVAVKIARRQLSTASLMFWSTLVTAIVLLIVALAAEPRLLPASSRGLAMLLALAIVSHAGGQGLLAYALGHLPATFSSLVIFLEAVAAAVLGLLVLGEQLNSLQVLGGFTILAGIWLARPGKGRNRTEFGEPA